jgi:hypothetical protein
MPTWREGGDCGNGAVAKLTGLIDRGQLVHAHPAADRASWTGDVFRFVRGDDHGFIPAAMGWLLSNGAWSFFGHQACWQLLSVTSHLIG